MYIVCQIFSNFIKIFVETPSSVRNVNYTSFTPRGNVIFRNDAKNITQPSFDSITASKMLKTFCCNPWTDSVGQSAVWPGFSNYLEAVITLLFRITVLIGQSNRNYATSSKRGRSERFILLYLVICLSLAWTTMSERPLWEEVAWLRLTCRQELKALIIAYVYTLSASK